MAVPTYNSPAERDDIRSAQNKQIKAQMRDWQLQWHALFDADPKFAPESEFQSDGKIPDEIDSDFRLIFGISQASPATRQACFALFPNGDAMCDRFERYLKGRADRLNADQVPPILQDLQTALGQCILNEEIDFATPQVFAEKGDESKAAFSMADRVTYLFERSGLEPYDEDIVTPSAALFFLTEPLYASANNWYEMGDWVTGVLGVPEEDRCVTILYDLWRGGWQVGLTDAGLIAAPTR